MEVRYFGAEMGWQTAMYRSADKTVKKMELVNYTGIHQINFITTVPKR
jgi:hypothetical protein